LIHNADEQVGYYLFGILNIYTKPPAGFSCQKKELSTFIEFLLYGEEMASREDGNTDSLFAQDWDW
jgi:hypothetical protein